MASTRDESTRQQRPLYSDVVDEFRHGWFVVLAGAIGTGVGIISASFSLSVLMKPLEIAFGWQREDIAIASSFCTGGLFLSGPWFGRLYDRFGVERIAPAAIVLLALTLASMAFLRNPIGVLYAAYFALGVLGGGTGYSAYARAVATWFDKARGLALSLTVMGPALAATLLPLLLPEVIVRYSWQGGYVALSCAALAALPLAIFCVRERDRPNLAETVSPGLGIRQAVRTRQFRLLAGGMFCVGLGLIGITLHLMPMLTDMGATPQYAAYSLSLSGIGIVSGRAVTGALLDRFFAPAVAACLFTVPAIAFLLFHFIGLPFGPVLGFMIGLSIGAEADVLGYLTSRYFGLRSYSEIFGWLFGAMQLGSTGSPLLVKAVYRYSGGYGVCLAVSAGLCLLAALLFALLGPYGHFTDTSTRNDKGAPSKGSSNKRNVLIDAEAPSR